MQPINIHSVVAATALILLSSVVMVAMAQISRTSNTITITDRSGSGLSGIPLQIGRPFLKGEIPGVPGLRFNDTIVTSQTEVTNRYPDGSVKFAIISAILPNLPANSHAYLNFFSTTPNVGSTCSLSNMLSDQPELEIKIKLEGNSTESTISLRDLISKGLYQWTTNGPVRCEMIVTDHSVDRKADVGLGGPKSFRPIFHLSHWVNLRKVRVRSILENTVLNTLQDVQYHVSMYTGLNSPQLSYFQGNVTHRFGTRWTKLNWFGAEPEIKYDLHYNVEYLALTNFVPNYSQNDTYTPSQITQYYNNFLGRPKQLNDQGFWERAMPTTGMRDDIGVMPQWTAYWLCNGDWRMRHMSLIQSDLAGAWRAHFREWDSSLYWDRNKTVSAIGKPISIYSHPTWWFPNNADVYIGALNVPKVNTPWIFDAAHQPDPYSVTYMLSGDYFYLESLQFWAAIGCTRINDGIYGRGMSGYAGIHEQLRGIAWTARSRMYASILSPDSSIERSFFYETMNDAISYWEGVRGIEDPRFNSTPNYQWARKNNAWQWSPLRFFSRDTNGRIAAIWQESMMLTVLGMMRDLEFPVEPILSEYHKVLTSQLAAPGHDYRYMAYYWAFTMYNSTYGYKWYDSWKEFKEQNDVQQPERGVDAVNGWKAGSFYARVVACASSFLLKYPNGPELYATAKKDIYEKFSSTFEYRSYRVYPKVEIAPIFRDVSTIPRPQDSAVKPQTSKSSSSPMSEAYSLTRNGMSLSVLSLLIMIVLLFTC